MQISVAKNCACIYACVCPFLPNGRHKLLQARNYSLCMYANSDNNVHRLLFQYWRVFCFHTYIPLHTFHAVSTFFWLLFSYMHACMHAFTYILIIIFYIYVQAGKELVPIPDPKDPAERKVSVTTSFFFLLYSASCVDVMCASDIHTYIHT
jgi:hypothetical protein